jgi:hypothetical protein
MQALIGSDQKRLVTVFCKQTDSNLLKAALTALAFLFFAAQITTSLHVSDFDHDLSNETLECGLCIHSSVNNDIDTEQSDFISLPINQSVSVDITDYRNVFSVRLAKHGPPRAPPFL